MNNNTTSSLQGSNLLVSRALFQDGHIRTDQGRAVLVSGKEERALADAIFQKLMEQGLITETESSTPQSQIYTLSEEGRARIAKEQQEVITSSAAFILGLNAQECMAFMDAAGYQIGAGDNGAARCSGATSSGENCRWLGHWKHKKPVISLANNSTDAARAMVHEIWGRLTEVDRKTVADRFLAR